MAVVKVERPTETADERIKMRVEDALNATRAGSSRGIVAGGGVALLRAAKVLDSLSDDDPDALTVSRLFGAHLEEPLRRIAQNAESRRGYRGQSWNDERAKDFNAGSREFET